MQIKPLSRMFKAAIDAAINSQCPAKFAALDVLVDGFRDLESLGKYLWNYDGPPENWPNFVAPSPTKQAAVLTVTGKPWSYWTGLITLPDTLSTSHR